MKKRGRRVTTVVTDHGEIEAESVIDAAGMWGREIAAMVGTRVPACAVEHQYFVTEKSERIPDNLPTLRDPDGSFYLKPEPGAFAVGGWEHNTPPWGANGIRTDFGPELLQADFERFAPLAEAASARIPVLNEVGIRQLINGPIPITADGEPIIGLSPELDNFYLCCGFTSGIAASGGAGWVMANWIVDGDPGLDLWPFDIRRFGAPHSVKQYMYERAVESYGRYYHIAWPTYEADAARGARRSPLYQRLAQAGAVYGNKFGWERPNWFAPPGTPAIETPSFERGPAFDAIGAEHRAVRERVALIDMSSFSKYEVRGPGALALLQRLAGQQSRSSGRHDRLHAALQRARRNRSRRDDHAARRRSLLFRHRQRARRARPLDDRAASSRRRQRRDRRAHVGQGGGERLRPALARGPREAH